MLNLRSAPAHSRCGRQELAEFDVRFADPLIGEGDALRVGERNAELAGLREFDDRRVVVAHQFQDLAAHETRHGQVHRGVMLGVPVDFLLVERQRLAVVAHAAHDQRQVVRRHDVRLGDGGGDAGAVRLSQGDDGQVLPIQPVLEQTACDQQAGIGGRAAGLHRARGLDRLDRARDAGFVVDVVGVHRQQFEMHPSVIRYQRKTFRRGSARIGVELENAVGFRFDCVQGGRSAWRCARRRARADA